MKRELPDDLARLGLYLEVAAGETLRRRQRRQAMANFVGAVTLAVPFALAVAAADLSPADGLLPAAAPAGLARRPAAPQQIHGSPHPGRAAASHAEGNLPRCSRLPRPVTRSLTPAPAGKH